jgi:hypothetical protein
MAYVDSVLSNADVGRLRFAFKHPGPGFDLNKRMQALGIRNNQAYVSLGTSSSSLTLTAGEPLFDLYSTCSSTSGSVSAEPLYVKSIMTGAGGVGGRSRFHCVTAVTLGGWVNALKGYMEFESSGRCAGLGSAVCAEMKIPSESIVAAGGGYMPLEVELVYAGNAVVSAGALSGNHVAFATYRFSGDTDGDFDDNGFFYTVTGLTAGAAHVLSTNSQSLKVGIGTGTTRYLVLSQAEDSLKLAGSASIGVELSGTQTTGISIGGTHTTAISCGTNCTTALAANTTLSSQTAENQLVNLDFTTDSTFITGTNLTWSGARGSAALNIVGTFSGATGGYSNIYSNITTTGAIGTDGNGVIGIKGVVTNTAALTDGEVYGAQFIAKHNHGTNTMAKIASLIGLEAWSYISDAGWAGTVIGANLGIHNECSGTYPAGSVHRGVQIFCDISSGSNSPTEATGLCIWNQAGAWDNAINIVNSGNGFTNFVLFTDDGSPAASTGTIGGTQAGYIKVKVGSSTHYIQLYPTLT